MCDRSTARFKDLASTCGVAQLNVTTTDNWKGDDTPEMVHLMRRQAVPRCRKCNSKLEARGKSICDSCEKVGDRVLLLFMLGVVIISVNAPLQANTSAIALTQSIHQHHSC